MSYASLPFEGVDWTPFDVIATDAGYRTAATAGELPPSHARVRGAGTRTGKARRHHRVRLRHLPRRGRFWQGRDALVAYGDDGRPTHLKGEYVRDEAEQATYLREVLEVFETEGIEPPSRTPSRATTTTSRRPTHGPRQGERGRGQGADRRPHTRCAGRRYPDVAWEPKAAFDALGDWYGR